MSGILLVLTTTTPTQPSSIDSIFFLQEVDLRNHLEQELKDAKDIIESMKINGVCFFVYVNFMLEVMYSYYYLT